MNKDTIDNRIRLIEIEIKKTNVQIEQLMANLNMLEGGKQECLYWLKTLESMDSNYNLINVKEV